MARLIHLDTDFGGDTDDLCALALLLGLPDVELTGITTCMPRDGVPAGMAAYALRLAGREDVPVADGADGWLRGRWAPTVADPARYWPEPVAPRPSTPGAALDLLAGSIARGATIVAIGPYTNLALLEIARPGILATAEVVLMGGLVTAIPAGLPQWRFTMDYNVQQDAAAARIVFESCNPLLVQIPVTVQVWIRGADLPRLRAAGPLGALLARQAELYGTDNHHQKLAREHPRLPDDLLNFQHDPLACAVAAGWEGVRIETLRLAAREEDGYLRFVEAPDGKPTRVVTAVDAAAFDELFFRAVEALPAAARG